MKKKLLACDMDGTLIHHYDQIITQQDLDSINEFRTAGNLFVLCTGRTLVWTLPVIKQYHMQTDGLVLCNGSMIYSVDSNNPLDIKEISNAMIPNKIGIEILEYFYNLENFTLYWDNGKNTYEIKDRLFESQTSVIQENHSIHITIDEVLKITDNFVALGITPMSARVDIAEQTKQDIITRWGDYVDIFRNQYFLDITPKESSKGAGLKILEKHLNIDVELFGIGDSWNDLPMFQTVGKDNAFFIQTGDPLLAEYTQYQVNNVTECINILLSK